MIEIIGKTGEPHNVPGAISIRYNHADDERLIKKIRTIKDKYIILFCK